MLGAEAGHRDRRTGDPAGAHAGCRPSSRISCRPAPPPSWPTTANGGLGLARHPQRLRLRRRRYGGHRNRNALPSIAALADPKQATADQRPARFIRIEKAVEIPDKKVRKINNSAFGPAGMGMREILAYAPIEPDGSVQDRSAGQCAVHHRHPRQECRRIGAQHTSWLQLMPGETKTCNGCHTSRQQHDLARPLRTDRPRSMPGAPTAGAPFPNTNRQPIGGQRRRHHGADTRASNTCRQTGTLQRDDALLANLEHRCDLQRRLDRSGRRRPRRRCGLLLFVCRSVHADSPTNAHCATWDPLCRSTIHYPDAAAVATADLYTSADMESCQRKRWSAAS